MTISITLAAVREATAAVVAEKGPDYDYKAEHDVCRYTAWREQPDGSHVQVAGCLVGAVVNRLGVPLPTLFQWDDSGADDLLNHLTSDIDGMDGLPWLAYADEDTAAYVDLYLSTAQAIQDKGGPGGTWGDALRIAEERLAAVRESDSHR